MRTCEAEKSLNSPQPMGSCKTALMMRDAKSVVVTGAGGMIGSATIRRLRAMGCSVLAIDIGEPTASYAGVTSFTADVTDPAQIDSIAATVRQLFGHADALV